MRLQVRRRRTTGRKRKTSRDTGGKKAKGRREIKQDGGIRQVIGRATAKDHDTHDTHV